MSVKFTREGGKRTRCVFLNFNLQNLAYCRIMSTGYVGLLVQESTCAFDAFANGTTPTSRATAIGFATLVTPDFDGSELPP